MGESDAAMIDVGEKVRPPGDPPDPGMSYAKTVTGTGAGRRLKPEDLVADEFVDERMKLVFPDGPEGEPVVTIESEVLMAMNGLWKQCMIVKALGRSVAISVLTKGA